MMIHIPTHGSLRLVNKRPAVWNVRDTIGTGASELFLLVARNTGLDGNICLHLDSTAYAEGKPANRVATQLARQLGHNLGTILGDVVISGPPGRSLKPIDRARLLVAIEELTQQKEQAR